MRIIIVGAGIAGLSLAWALNRRGFAVEVFEQGPIPNPIASSYDEHRITRHAYGPMAGYAALMPAAFRVWEQLWRVLGSRHYAPIGALWLAHEDGEPDWLPASLASLDAQGIAWRDVPRAELARRLPMVRADHLVRAVETEGAGMLFPVRILTDLAVHLAARGVRLHAYSKVRAIDPEHAHVQVGATSFSADRVAVTAGAWAGRLVPELQALALPSRQAVLYLSPPREHAAAWAEAPVMIHLSEAAGNYTLPPRYGTRLKIGDHSFTRRGDPDAPRLADDADLQRLRQVAARAYEGFARYCEIERKACYYTVEARERFIVRSLGARGWLVSACSGHGFKLQPLITEGVAQAMAGERPADEIEPWAAGQMLGPG